MDPMINEFFQKLLSMFLLLLTVVILDLVGGIILAVKNKTFKWEKLPEFLLNFGLYLWAWLAMELVAFLPGYLGVEVEGFAEFISTVLPSGVYALIVFKYLTGIVSNVNAIVSVNPIATPLGKSGF